MQVDLNKLKTFHILAGTQSYTGCADKLCLTQSAVSHAIKKLEADLGFELVDRQNRRFKLTSQGEFLYRRCEKIFNDLEETMEDLSVGKNHPAQICLGAPVEFGSSVLIKGMGPFLRRHPQIHVDFILDAMLLDPLLSDTLDIIIDCVPHVHEDLTAIPLLREAYCVIASPAYIREKQIETIQDLNRCTLLSMDKKLLWWKNFINALTEEADFGFRRIIQVSNIRGIINGVLTSLGVGFVPRYTVLRELEQGMLSELFPETAVLNDQINIYLKKRHLKNQAFRDLIDHIKSLKLH